MRYVTQPENTDFGEQPAGGCVSYDVESWPGTLDVLSLAPQTHLSALTAMSIDVENFAEGEHVIATDEQTHRVAVHVSLREETGLTSVVVVGGYVIALALDREMWRAGSLPDEKMVEATFNDCMNVLMDRGHKRYAQWLAPRVATLLLEWREKVMEVLAKEQEQTPPAADA